VQKGSGELAGEAWEEIVFEGYGPGGVAILVETATDNRNRTVSELRHAFSKHGGNLGESGCVAWMFTKRGWFSIERESLGEEDLLDLALEVGAEDTRSTDDGHELYCAAEEFHQVREAMERRGVRPEAALLAMVPQSPIEPEAAAAARALRLLEALEDQNDVQHVWSNLEVAEGEPVGSG
jgi:YebC/PmpR family DNA-binding regulatory protein